MPSVLSPKTLRTPHQPRDIRGSSPNYFGLAIDGSGTNATSSGARGVRHTFSPSSTGLRPSATSPPQTLPFHSTTSSSELDAFRREVEKRKSGYNDINPRQTATPGPDATGEAILPDTQPPLQREESQRTTPPQSKNPSIATLQRSNDHGEDRARPMLSSPKRMLSDFALEHDRPKRQSPDPPTRSFDLKLPKLNSQMSVSHEDTATVYSSLSSQRAETLPQRLEPEMPGMCTPQHTMTLLESWTDEVLLLDLRVNTQYAKSHIRGALNLCVPTTLLKRPTYSVAKLADTFKDPSQRAYFEGWQKCKYIIVYDINSTALAAPDAANCKSILKKFKDAGWAGESGIIRGGFSEFAAKFPHRIDKGDVTNRKSSGPNMTLKMDGPLLAPVIGGCPLPATKGAVNPFFGNIRQNMDLIGGVGQMPVKRPADMSKQQFGRLPAWLRTASAEDDEGKLISQKFLHIEKEEQRRMQEALSGNVAYGTPGPKAQKRVQIAGVEKGAKNRYNNIWPFEHTRVKLDDVPSHGCDYINANNVGTSLSHKRYIATQGPIPATFGDFWSMVWQEDVRVLVMLTAESEGGQVKAHNYWDQKHYGQMKLKHLSEHRASLDPNKIRQHRQRPNLERRRSSQMDSASTPRAPGDVVGPKVSKIGDNSGSPNSPTDQPYIVVRKFTLAHEGQPFEPLREITQLHYSSWPDFGAPADPAHLLGIVQQCNAVVQASAGSRVSVERPVLVHCSAGCGRTGTFCTVDTVLELVKRQKSLQESSKKRQASPLVTRAQNDDPFFSPSNMPARGQKSEDWLTDDNQDLIEKTVEQFRHQRLSMVQSLRQFVLCYETVLEWLIMQDQAQLE